MSNNIVLQERNFISHLLVTNGTWVIMTRDRSKAISFSKKTQALFPASVYELLKGTSCNFSPTRKYGEKSAKQ